MTDVLIVGAGPVGLLLAALLGRRGRTVLVLDKKTKKTYGSNAIGITPPSLELLAKLGLDQTLTLWGAPIRHVTVHGPVPVSAAWIVVELPLQIVALPLTTEVGRALTVTTALPVLSPACAVQLASVSTVTV